MRRHASISVVLLLALGALLVLTVAAGADETAKIPITTKSEKAREYYLIGRDLAEKLRGQNSIEYFEKAVAEDPEFAVAYLNLAFVAPTAKAFFENLDKARALADQVSEGERLWILGADAGAKALPMKQRELYRKLAEVYPGDERAWNLLGNHYFGLQEYALAIEEYRKATEIAPDFSPPYNQLGYAHRFLEQYAAAEEAFKKYIQLIPDDPNPYDSYAELLMKTGRYDESIKAYEKALAIDPNFVASHIGIATDLDFKGQHKAARRQIDRLHALARNDGERRAAHFAKAVSYVAEGAMADAIAELEKQYALAAKINDAAAMAGDLGIIGNILYEWGRYDEALRKYELAVDLVKKSNLSQEIKDNTELNFLYSAATVALKQGDWVAARAGADKYLNGTEAARNPNLIRLAHQLLGMIALEAKDYPEALAELAQASQQDPYNLYRIALAHKGAGDTTKAREFSKKAADFNALNNMNQAFVREKARQLLNSM